MDIYTPYTLIPALAYVAAMGAFTVAFLVDWIRSFEQIYRYWKHAVVAAAILVGLHLLMIAIAPGEWTMVRIVGLMSLPLLFVRVVGFTMLGTYYCARIGCPSFRLLPQEPPFARAVPDDDPPSPANDGVPRIASVGPDIWPAIAEMPAEPVPHVDNSILDIDVPVARTDDPVFEVDIPILQADVPVEQAIASPAPATGSLRRYAWDILIVAAASAIYSALLFLLTKPQIAEMIERVFRVSRNAADAGTYTPFTVLLVLAFAFSEELFFRLGIQNFLARYLRWQGNRYWAAIALTSFVWTLGHAGVLDPNWVKFAQIFPVGLMLGWLFRKHGVEACILAHGLFNIIMIAPSSILLT